MKPKKESVSEISILEVNQGELSVCILGESPFIYNAMSEKVRQTLLMPAPKKNAAERASSLKHEPLAEYRASVYHHIDKSRPTHLSFPASGFKKALAGAALDIPGAAKAQIGRLVWVCGDRVDMYGAPKMLMSVTRSSDINRTPDVRTRAILPEWACKLTLRYMKPILKEQTIANLLAAAGMIRGVGDWRQEKGSGSYGQFRLVSEDDADFVRICAEGQRKVQLAALETPSFYDDETQKLFDWFIEERARRGDAPVRKNGSAKTTVAAMD